MTGRLRVGRPSAETNRPERPNLESYENASAPFASAHLGRTRLAIRIEAMSARLLRPAKFALLGAVCAVTQLGLLIALTERTNLGPVSNTVAFLLAAQLNFALNSAFTWRDRMQRPRVALVAQLLGFNVLILVAAAFNQAIYVVGLRVAPYLIAGAVGILATTIAKYFVADRWIFQEHHRLRGWQDVRSEP